MSISILLSAGLLSLSLPSYAEEQSADSLQAVTVTAERGVKVSLTDSLIIENSVTVADVLNRSNSLYVGDNGGFSGLKTVSIRGMGTAGTSVYVDGFRVGNVQSGQSDLGMIGLENCGSIVVDYARSSISFNMARPVFRDSPVAGTARLSAGSFGTYLPSARLDFRLSDCLALSASASGVISRGDFAYDDGCRRENNDIRQVRAGLDLFGVISGGDYHIKAYFNDSERGTPGPVGWPSDDRQKDMNIFLQTSFRRTFSETYTLHLGVKASYDDIFYSSTWGDTSYGQTEIQLNSSHLFNLAEWLRMSLTADLHWDGLESTAYVAHRLTAFSALAAAFRKGRFSADLALEYDGAYDTGGLSRNALSPSLGLRVSIAEGFGFVAFSRRTCRIPTFNELYYVGYGNPDLSSETAWLNDAGFIFDRKVGACWKLKAKLDGFLNFLTDKITSAPTDEDPSVWRPYNIGKVRSAGLDSEVCATYENPEWKLVSCLNYTFQPAVDLTRGSPSYGIQIPYIARHSLSADITAVWRRWNLNLLWHFRAGRTDGYGALPGWNTLDANLSRPFDLRKAGLLHVRLALRNILNERYETVSGYPMPCRNMTIGVEYRF